MSKKILVLSGSPRRGGNSDKLGDEFIRGAKEAGCETEKIFIKDKEINGCMGCCVCTKNGGTCVQKDEMHEIYEKMIEADVIVFAAPVYFYTFNAQMKELMDRTIAIHEKWSNKTVYMISSGQAPEEKYMTTMIDCFRKYVGCFKDMKEGGILFGYGTSDVGDIKDNPALEQAYEMGKNI